METTKIEVHELKTRFELNFHLSLYSCLWYSVKMSETRAATKAAAVLRQKQQGCSNNRNRLTQEREVAA